MMFVPAEEPAGLDSVSGGKASLGFWGGRLTPTPGGLPVIVGAGRLPRLHLRSDQRDHPIPERGHQNAGFQLLISDEQAGEEHPPPAHSRYNALIRRLVSFERALEREEAGDQQADGASRYERSP